MFARHMGQIMANASMLILSRSVVSGSGMGVLPFSYRFSTFIIENAHFTQ